MDTVSSRGRAPVTSPQPPGRPEALPFSQIAQWVMLAPISIGAKLLYVLLVMHVNRADETNRKAWPTRETLAAMAGYSRAQTVDPYIKELEKLGAVTVDRGRHPTQPLRKRNYYQVLLATDPAPIGAGDLSLSDYYKRVGEEDPGQPGCAVERTSGVAEPVEPLAEPSPGRPEVRSTAHREVRPTAPRDVRLTAQELDVVDLDQEEIDEVSSAPVARAAAVESDQETAEIKPVHFCGVPGCVQGYVLTEHGITWCTRPTLEGSAA